MPLIILITLSTRIYQGLLKVKKNLNRHKRLVERAETAETIGDKSPLQKGTHCTLKLDVINEQDQMEGNLRDLFYKIDPMAQRIEGRLNLNLQAHLYGMAFLNP